MPFSERKGTASWELFHSVRKLDVLQELIEDETVTGDHGERTGCHLCGTCRKIDKVGQKTFTLEKSLKMSFSRLQVSATGWSTNQCLLWMPDWTTEPELMR